MIQPISVVLEKNEFTPAMKASMLAIMTATAVATNYILIGVVNVKFMDIIVFTGGYLFGSVFGATLGALIWLVYGTVNPYGVNLVTLSATILGEMLYGIAGSIIGGRLRVKPGWSPDLRFGVVGFLLTFVYDLFTNIVSAFVAGIPISVALISGVPFSVMHELSNAVFFAIGLPPLLQSIRSMIQIDE